MKKKTLFLFTLAILFLLELNGCTSGVKTDKENIFKNTSWLWIGIAKSDKNIISLQDVLKKESDLPQIRLYFNADFTGKKESDDTSIIPLEYKIDPDNTNRGSYIEGGLKELTYYFEQSGDYLYISMSGSEGYSIYKKQA